MIRGRFQEGDVVYRGKAPAAAFSPVRVSGWE
jgi:hypothetical protein